MKKYLLPIIIVLASIPFMSSCKKDGDRPADYAASIKDKTWWGVSTYTGETSQYYTVHFNGDNTLVWSQLSGDYAGQWTITDKIIIITIVGINIKIQAEISNENNLVNISDNSPTLDINNGKLLTYANGNLEGTVWNGSALAGGGSSATLQISFLANLKAEIKLNNTVYPPYAYVTTVSGRAFRINTLNGNQYFGVRVSANEIKGSAQASQFPFQLTKR